MNTLKNILLKLRFALLAVILFTVYGCGGGGGGGTAPAAGSSTLSGTAAAGAPIAGATVHIKGANGVMVETTTDADGKYTSPNLATLTAPYLVHVIKVGPPAIELYSIGSAAGVVNVHPLTDLIIRTWYEVQGTDVGIEFAKNVPAPPPTATELGVIKQVVKNLVAQFLGLIGNIDSTSFDLISTPFTANSTGFDRLLDNIQVNAASGVIGINTSGVSGVGTLAEYHATLAVSGTAMTSTLAEDLNNDATFTTVSTATNTMVGGTAPSPYAGVWSLNFTQTVVGNPNLCGGFVGDTGTLSFVVDSNGNFILLETDGSARPMISGNITANGSLTAIAYGDSLLPTGTCPAGTLTATFTTTSAGTGTFAQGGDQGNLVFARLSTTPSPFAGTWVLSHTATQVLDTVNCGEALATLNTPIVDGDGLLVIDAAGNFSSVASAISGHVSNTGAVTFSDTNAGACTFISGTGTISGSSGSGTFGTPGTGDLSGTWTLVRSITALSPFNGTYTASSTVTAGTNIGAVEPFSFTVTNGVVTGGNSGGGAFSGTVSSSGVVTMSFGGGVCTTTVSVAFSGQATPDALGGVTMTGTFSDPGQSPVPSGTCSPASGTWTATRQ